MASPVTRATDLPAPVVPEIVAAPPPPTTTTTTTTAITASSEAETTAAAEPETSAADDSSITAHTESNASQQQQPEPIRQYKGHSKIDKRVTFSVHHISDAAAVLGAHSIDLSGKVRNTTTKVGGYLIQSLSVAGIGDMIKAHPVLFASAVNYVQGSGRLIKSVALTAEVELTSLALGKNQSTNVSTSPATANNALNNSAMIGDIGPLSLSVETNQCVIGAETLLPVDTNLALRGSIESFLDSAPAPEYDEYKPTVIEKHTTKTKVINCRAGQNASLHQTQMEIKVHDVLLLQKLMSEFKVGSPTANTDVDNEVAFNSLQVYPRGQKWFNQTDREKVLVVIDTMRGPRSCLVRECDSGTGRPNHKVDPERVELFESIVEAWQHLETMHDELVLLRSIGIGGNRSIGSAPAASEAGPVPVVDQELMRRAQVSVNALAEQARKLAHSINYNINSTTLDIDVQHNNNNDMETDIPTHDNENNFGEVTRGMASREPRENTNANTSTNQWRFRSKSRHCKSKSCGFSAKILRFSNAPTIFSFAVTQDHDDDCEIMANPKFQRKSFHLRPANPQSISIQTQTPIGAAMPVTVYAPGGRRMELSDLTQGSRTTAGRVALAVASALATVTAMEDRDALMQAILTQTRQLMLKRMREIDVGGVNDIPETSRSGYAAETGRERVDLSTGRAEKRRKSTQQSTLPSV